MKQTEYKKILLLTGVLALFTTAGCVFSEGERHGHSRGPAHFEHHSEVIVVGPPPVVVRPPVIVVRPPEIIVR